MDFLKKIKNMNFDKTGFNENILHNTYMLYFISILSFGNFFIEMIEEDMYFISVYIIIGFLTSFFNKNMIIILSISLIFANILKYGRESTVEGFDEEEPNDVEKVLGIDDPTDEDGVIDEIVGEKKDKDKKDNKDKKDKKDKKEKQEKQEKQENNSDDQSDEEEDIKKSKKKKTKEEFSEKELKNMEYKESKKLLENQNLLLKNMKEYKPFLDTIQGLAKNVSGFVKKDDE